jgi:acetyltransferase-like isoleucine patch superfamily enzyme
LIDTGRKLIIHILQYRAKKRLARFSGVKIDATAKVNFRGVNFRSGCTLEIGTGSIVEAHLNAEREGASIIIGTNTFIGSSRIDSAARIEVGDDVLISWGCSIADHNSHAIRWPQREHDVRYWYQGKKDWTHVKISPVKIGNKSWLGQNVIILKGVEIGEGAIVAAGSVVAKSVPPWTMVGGNPARVIRELSLEER